MKRLLHFVIATAFASSVQASDIKSQVYGYVEGYVEQVEESPSRSGGTATSEGTLGKAANPHEFDTPNISIMVKSSKGNKYSSYLNIDASGDSLQTKNAWVDVKVKGDLFKFRIGKMYRPFGIYNERLDAVPTYIGIEPPELFDGDHLLLTRTTNMMLHGEKDLDGNTLRYSLTTGNEERSAGEVPVGGDVRYTYIGETSEIMIGTSFYFSNKAVPTQEVGGGSPNGGVANWMSEDEYKVLGLYLEYTRNAFKFQTAYYEANHDAKRSGTKLQGMDTAALNDEQIQRLCSGNMSTCADSEVNYSVKTWYVRTGYSFETSIGEVTPYVQYDYYENPESVADKSNGGDNEAGIADDGAFVKQTLGVVIRPDSQFAIKVDASSHIQEIDDSTETYSEIRSSFSYIWSL
jgi:hypothetical protein